MFRSLARLALAVTCLALIAATGAAHDSWIYGGGYRNAAGEWCCGEGDCFEMPKDIVRMDGSGYWLFELEHIPYSEAQPSPDGAFWRCKRPDGSRRCFFAPPPAT
jgi:hypothetical protein